MTLWDVLELLRERLAALRETGQLDNTLVIYAADNGASGEGSPSGSTNENKFFNGFPDSLEENLKYLDELGSPTTYNHYPTGWAAAFSTPFKMFKRYSQFSGGTCDPMIIHWPAGIAAKGEVQRLGEDAIFRRDILVVQGVVAFGVFVALGEATGLVHKSNVPAGMVEESGLAAFEPGDPVLESRTVLVREGQVVGIGADAQGLLRSRVFPGLVLDVEALLRDTQFEIVGMATTGEQAVQKVEKLKPDILLLDLQMPGGTGMDVLRRVRSGGSNVWFVPQSLGGRSCYRVFYGRFPDREEWMDVSVLFDADGSFSSLISRAADSQSFA